MYKHPTKMLLVLVYVDILIGYKEAEQMQELTESLHGNCGIKVLDDLFFLGMHVVRDYHGN